MADTLRHRGPDDAGAWVDPAAGIALAVRRLAIVDLSMAGHQPMASSTGRYVIAYNGEIYNFRELRDQLIALGWAFRGHSDTEVLLAAISQWNVEPVLRRCNGMFAFALWDREDRALYLARDRMGEKPLYYGWTGSTLLFGSELKALRAHPDFKADVDRNALAIYLRHNHVPSPYSIYQGIFKLPPATYLRIALADTRRLPQPVAYWSLKEVAESAAAQPFSGDALEATTELQALLQDAVSRRMVADVPVGAFLSGGIDSSTVVALMQTGSDQKVKTFSIGSDHPRYDEARKAAAVAAHLGTEHTELYVSPAEAMQVIPLLPAIYDEPFADASQIPTLLVSRLAREQVTVSLSGDGGDEVFGGYNRHVFGEQAWNRVGWMPRRARQAAGSILAGPSAKLWETLGELASSHREPAAARSPNQMQKLGALMQASGREEIYRRLVSHWNDPVSVVPGASEPSTLLTDVRTWPALPTLTESMMYLDTLTYLPDDILVKVDRATMNVSLEARVPYLDPRVIEFAWRLPLGMKIRDGLSKWILRQVLDRYVPAELVDRTKAGFAVAVDDWLRGSLRDWAESLLDEGRLRAEGYFDPRPIRQKWSEHLAGQRNWQDPLWCILMFECWLEQSRLPAAISVQ